ncbi:hypothetical protein JZ751_007500 [Albula glossodonta]|uniref:Myeloid-associated differentiation marker-like protein 2 n=1 Tax=Albula glossodonta TaxID=121402 RepID=A0A8T2N3B5_9TELE|nr:hypothetical protein JZ751_007500 [Albula glossodonta]
MGVAMDPQGVPLLNWGALISPIGVVRLCQLALGSAIVSLVKHQAGHTGAPYGWLCMAVWCFCLAGTAIVLVLDIIRLHCCCRVSWGDLTAAHAAAAALIYATASVLYPFYFLRPAGCPYSGCQVRNYRIAVTTCSCAGSLAYAAEVYLSRTKPGYMATAPGLLKVAQAYVACLTFGGLLNGSDYNRHVPMRYCVAVYATCFAANVVVIMLAIAGRATSPNVSASRRTSVNISASTSTDQGPRLPFYRVVAVYTFLAVLLYLSAAVVWPIFSFDSQYGSPTRPYWCPRGRCPWDARLLVTICTFVNLALYAADLACSQRLYPQSQQPPGAAWPTSGVRGVRVGWGVDVSKGELGKGVASAECALGLISTPGGWGGGIQQAQRTLHCCRICSRASAVDCRNPSGCRGNFSKAERYGEAPLVPKWKITEEHLEAARAAPHRLSVEERRMSARENCLSVELGVPPSLLTNQRGNHKDTNPHPRFA